VVDDTFIVAWAFDSKVGVINPTQPPLGKGRSKSPRPSSQRGYIWSPFDGLRVTAEEEAP